MLPAEQRGDCCNNTLLLYGLVVCCIMLADIYHSLNQILQFRSQPPQYQNFRAKIKTVEKPTFFQPFFDVPLPHHSQFSTHRKPQSILPKISPFHSTQHSRDSTTPFQNLNKILPEFPLYKTTNKNNKHYFIV